MPPDEFPVVKPEDVTDDRLVAKRLDNLSRDMNDGFERLELKLERLLERRTDDADRLDEIEARLRLLEAAAG